MMEYDYIISCDTTCDMPASFMEENGIGCSMLRFTINGNTQSDDLGRSMRYKEFYDLQRAGEMSTTSQTNVDEYLAIFEPLVQSGKDILHINLSSGLSGSYNSAKLAADEVMERFPDRRITVIDSLGASMGQGLLLYYVVQMRKAGRGYAETCKWAEENRLRIVHWFTVDDLNFLHRGGRVSKAAAFFGTMMGIKPVMNVDEEGHLIVRDKIRGRRASLDSMLGRMKKTIENPANQVVFISHSDCLDDAQYLGNRIKETFPEIKEVVYNFIGPVIGSHTGPGAVALFFVGSREV